MIKLLSIVLEACKVSCNEKSITDYTHAKIGLRLE